MLTPVCLPFPVGAAQRRLPAVHTAQRTPNSFAWEREQLAAGS